MGPVLVRPRRPRLPLGRRAAADHRLVADSDAGLLEELDLYKGLAVAEADEASGRSKGKMTRLRRLLMLIIAITIHNFPEGMAVGVAFGAIGSAPGASFGSAVSLALGIGIQNFPEGLAVSMPLMREGVTPLKAFMYGRLSGLVEPIGGVLGAAFVHYCHPMLPYTMSRLPARDDLRRVRLAGARDAGPRQ